MQYEMEKIQLEIKKQHALARSYLDSLVYVYNMACKETEMSGEQETAPKFLQHLYLVIKRINHEV